MHSLQVSMWLETQVSKILVSSCEYNLSVQNDLSYLPDTKKAFLQVCECHLTHSGIDFITVSSIFFMNSVVCTLKSILIDNILEVTVSNLF